MAIRICCFFCFVFASCTYSVRPGTYVCKSSSEVLNINKDSTYEYSRNKGVGNSEVYSSGTWKGTADRTISLTSIFQQDDYPIEVLERQRYSEYTRFDFDSVYTLKKGNAIWQALLINDSVEVPIENTILDMETSVRSFRLKFYYNNYRFNDGSVDSIYTRSLISRQFKPLDQSSNLFRVTYRLLKPGYFFFKHFTDEKVVYRRRSVLFTKEKRKFRLL